jgi:predicted NBD/HSP70 family sugar kinase
VRRSGTVRSMKKELPAYIANRLTFEGLASSRGLLQLADREGLVTQRQAAEHLGLSAGTCNLHFQKLEHLGLIHRVAEVSGRGRSTIQWEIETDKNLCIQIVFDVPFFLATLTDFKGNVLLSERQDLTSLSDKAKLQQLVDGFVVRAQNIASESGGTIRQVFMGLPGMLDQTHSKVVKAVNFPVLNGVDFKQMMSERYDLPCECGSLGMAFYYGELEQLPPETHAMVLHWDLGIGVVAGVGERIISIGSEKWLLADIGHIRILKEGRPCHCGGKGCFEAYTGGWSMIDELGRDDIKSLTDLRKAIGGGDEEALRVAKAAAYMIGKNLCWPIQVRGSKRLIITGPLSPILKHVRPALIEGLATLFSEEEIAALDPQASNDPQLALQRGSARLARRFYIYPEG